MELEVAVELGNNLDGGDGEGGDLLGAGAGRAGAGAGGAGSATERGRGGGVVAARTRDHPLGTGSKAATRLTLGITIVASETREAEATIVEVGRTGRHISPGEPARLLRVTRVIRVIGAAVSREIVEALGGE